MDTQTPPAPESEDHLGMTEAQWAQWQAYTHGYGEQDENGVDISLLRENLKLTPTERLRKHQRGMPVRRPDGLHLGRDAQQVLGALGHAQVRFVVVGQTAMFLQGTTELMQDIDIAFASDPQNINALVLALRPLNPRLRGAPLGLLFSWNVRTVQSSVNLTLETDAGSIDLYLKLPGVASFEALWRASTISSQQGVPVRVASVEDLIAMKRAANRPKDQAHLLELEALRRLQTNSAANG